MKESDNHPTIHTALPRKYPVVDTDPFYLAEEYAIKHYQYDIVLVTPNWEQLTLRITGFNGSLIHYDEFDNRRQLASAVRELYKHSKTH